MKSVNIITYNGLGHITWTGLFYLFFEQSRVESQIDQPPGSYGERL